MSDDWYGLYSEGWQGEIVPDAFAHPAKFSRALIRAIYDHAAAEGWLAAGDVVIDPFGGVALGGIDAMRLGCHWIGGELEQKFVDLGRANIELWESRYRAHFPAWGTARLLQGDSRQLAANLAGAGLCVSSPPYAGYDDHGGRATAAERDRRRLERIAPERIGRFDTCFKGSEEYGDSPGQLGTMREGNLSLAVSSPPYEGSVNQSSQANDAVARIDRKAVAGVDVAKSVNIGGPNSVLRQAQVYGVMDGQIGAESGDTFWAAARTIVEQVYQVLKPGGHAIWVVKAFVRNKERVDFPGQWRALCESCGFVTLHQHRAWLVEEHPTQYDLWGNGHAKRVERKSFFRRLAESKGSPRIDWEDVICMEKRP